MAHINIRIIETDDIHEQYQSIGAFFELSDREFLLDSVLLDTEDYEEDLDLVEDFCTAFEVMANDNKIEIIFHPEVDALIDELQTLYAEEQEDIKVEEEKTMKRCAD